MKTDSGYPKDTGVNKPWQPLGIPSAITPIGQIHQQANAESGLTKRGFSVPRNHNRDGNLGRNPVRTDPKFGRLLELEIMVHDCKPAILPSLLACDLAKLAEEANRVCPNETDYVRTLSHEPKLSLTY